MIVLCARTIGMFSQIIIGSGESQTKWAARLGISRSYLSDILAGNKTPSLALAVKIQTETGGAVTCESWVPAPADGLDRDVA
jgi:DNA-binding transcriptional regulator YdaS (Cro superfamily)